MKTTNTYLIFDGNCRQAMEFYQRCLGGELHLVTYADMPGGLGDLPREAADWIMHASLTLPGTVLMASDTRPGLPVKQGDNFFISIQCESVQEVERLFKALSRQGKVAMPVQETFWAQRFAMLTDQFGIQWMLNLEKPAEQRVGAAAQQPSSAHDR